MPFEGLNFGLARPNVQLENPLDLQMKAQQGQLQELQLQQQTAAMQRENDFRQGLQGVGNDPQKIQELLTRTGKFKEAQEYAKSLKDTEAAKVGLQNEYLKHDALERTQLMDMSKVAGSAAQGVMQIQDPHERWQAWQQTLPKLAQQFQPTENDSPRMRQIKQGMIQQLQGESQSLMAMKGPGDLDALLNKHIQDSKTHEDWMKEAEQTRANNRVVGFHPAIGPDNKPGIFQTTAGGDVRQVPGLKPVPPQTMNVQVGGGAPSASPSQRSSRAEQIANGEIPVPKPTRGDPTALRDAADARQIMIERGDDPETLPGLYSSKKAGQESFAAGKPNARIITAINTASDHTEKILRPAAAALNNGDWQTANKLMNAIGVNMGANEKTNFDSVATFLATEVAKVASGGGQPTLAEIAEARKMFPAEGSNRQIMGAIDIANRIMGGKLSALDIEHKNAFNGKSILDMKRLSPEAVRNVASTGNGPASPQAKPLPASMVGGLPPKVAQDYMSGKKIKMTDDDGTVTYYQKVK